MLEQSCLTFLQKLSSKEPVPGGGGASALVGALGMALGSMVGNLTTGKAKYQDVQPDIESLLERSAALTTRLTQLVQQDADAFFPLSQAYGMPKATPEEAAERNRVMQQALVGAALVPLEIARCCAEAIALLEEYAHKGTRIAISDAGVGAAFCKAALQSAKLNVLINTRLMQDTALKETTEKEIQKLELAGISQADRIFAYVESALRA